MKKNQVFSKIFFKTPTHSIKKLYQFIALNELNMFMGFIFINCQRKKIYFNLMSKCFFFIQFFLEINQLTVEPL